MVRQRKDGESVERTDGSRPTWKVTAPLLWALFLCLHIALCLSGCRAPPLCFLFLSHIKFTHARTRRQIFTSNMVSNRLFASSHLNPGVLPVSCNERSFIPCGPVSQNAKQTGCINRPFQHVIICITSNTSFA